jgi:hypothetical protein
MSNVALSFPDRAISRSGVEREGPMMWTRDHADS